MNRTVELVEQLERSGEESPLARARLQRQLTVEETARRAGLSEEQARWLEEGRVYRFPTPDDALVATLLYATALGIDNREARELAGLPVPAAPTQQNPLPRLIVLCAIVIGLAAVVTVVLTTRGSGGTGKKSSIGAAVLPPPWRIPVSVLNGSGDIVYTRRVADHVLAQGYHVKRVAPADNFSYPQTAVYFPPRCEAVAVRLAKQLGVATKALPGGSGPCQLYVIVGPARGPGG